MTGKRKDKSRWVSIGKYPAWSIRQARKAYETLYEKVHEYGIDPVQEERDQIARDKTRQSVREFTDKYLELGRLREKKSVYEEQKYFERDIFPVIGEKMLDDVSMDDIEDIERRIIRRARSRDRATRNGRVAARHAIACTRRLFSLAVKKNKCAQNPVIGIESLGETGSRDRVLSFKEIWLFWNKLEVCGVPPVTASAVKFSLVTMQRSTEIRHMRYSAIKTDEGVWHMERHETKNQTMHRVPLNRHALELIEQARAYTGSSEYVFGATRAQKPPRKRNPDLKPFGKSAFPQAIRRSRETLGIDNFCPHDLRRTGATWITAAGLPKLYARLMLNHSDGDRDVTGEVYVQYSYDFEKQRAAQVWEFVLDQIVSAPTIEDVPTLEDLRQRVVQARLL